MERIPSFDDPPEPNRLSSLMLLLAIAVALAIVPAGVALGQTAAGWAFFAFMLSISAWGVAREITAVVLHTRYTLMDLWFGVALCGAVVGGILTGMNEAIANESDPRFRAFAWASAAALALLALYVMLKGLYLGLRLALWLKTESPARRFGLLLLGVAGYVAHFGWRICVVASALLALALLERFRQQNAQAYAGVLSLVLLAGGIFFVITRVHLGYRKRAQANFEADPDALGKAGRLVPEGGRAGVMRVLGNAVGFALRVLSGGRG